MARTEIICWPYIGREERTMGAVSGSLSRGAKAPKDHWASPSGGRLLCPAGD